MENTYPTTLQEAITRYADEQACIDDLAAQRWPDAVVCPRCGAENPHWMASVKRWKCRNPECKPRQFSVKVGTIFEDSPISLCKWLPAVWLITNAKNGISSYEVARDLGVTQKTAWFMLHRIRLAMQDGDDSKLCGEVEVDETFIGGKARNMHADKRREKITGRGHAGKTAVMGLLERQGKVRTAIVPNTKRETLQPKVRKNVEPGSAIFSDDLYSYKGLDDAFTHEVVNHAVEYVRGRVHTNSLENYWSLLKRAIKGTYVSVEPWHLFRYLDEEDYRFNTRKQNDAERFVGVLNNVTGRRLMYNELIGQDV